MSSLQTFCLEITGHVQGVFFRANAKALAEELGLTGWVRNEPGANLSIVIQGPPEWVERFVEWARCGPPHARVDHINIKEKPDAEIYEEFEIRYD